MKSKIKKDRKYVNMIDLFPEEKEVTSEDDLNVPLCDTVDEIELMAV